MMMLIVGLLVVAAATVAYVALRNAQDFSDANEIIPGVPTAAPKAWAGAHTTEARLHRRLRDAVAAIRANASLDDPAMNGVREQVQQQALAVDERLIAAAALPKNRRDEPLRQIETAVSAIEDTVAAVVDLRGPSVTSIEQGIADVRARLELVESARAELEAMSPMTPGLDDLRRQLDATADPSAGEPPAGEATDEHG